MVFPSERTFRSPGRDDPEPERAPVQPSTRALAGLLPISDIPLRVTLVPVARRDPERAGRLTGTVAIVLGAPLEASEPPVPTETLDVEIRAFDPEGRKQLEVVTRRFEWSWRSGPRSYDILDAMDLAPGRYSLRFGVHDVERRRIGSVYADVTVPDFETAPLSLSGVALGLESGPLAVAPESIAELLPIVPTTQRVFAAFDRVTAFLRVYQGGGFLRPFQPITVTARIRDVHDTVVYDDARRLMPRVFNAATRGADVSLPLPLARLAPGEYLLTVHAAMDGTTEATVERKVRFRVTPGG